MSGRRHLTRAEALGVLRRRQGVAQLLDSGRTADGTPTVRYAYVGGTRARRVEAQDDGGPEFWDVGEFTLISQDEAEDLGTADAALAHAEEH